MCNILFIEIILLFYFCQGAALFFYTHNTKEKHKPMALNIIQ